MEKFLPEKFQEINNYLSAVSLQVGARLLHYHSQWFQITQDKLVLQIVKNGLILDFISLPAFTGVKETVVPRVGTKRSSILEEVNSLLEKHAIEPVPTSAENQGYYSTIFMVPKRQGGLRPILNLKPLNQFVIPHHFKMETLRSILKSLKIGDWAVKLDLQDAYFHIPIHKHYRKFLRFSILGKKYQYRALPFGLRSAPRIFTKVMAVVGAFLRKQMIHIFMYLDDWMLKNSSKVKLTKQLQYTQELLKNLGLIINVKKSCLVPTQIIEYLGAVIHLKEGLVFPSLERFKNISQMIQIFLNSQTVEARVMLRLLGLMASCIDLVPWARLHMRPLQLYLLAWWRPALHSLNHLIPLYQPLQEHLFWWLNRRNFFKGVLLEQESAQVTLVTDASQSGWGAHINNYQIAGVWSPQYKVKHINWLELKAVQLALQTFLIKVQFKSVLVRTDNATVVSYLNKQGGTRSPDLCYLAWDLLKWCINHNVKIQAVHIPGKKNIIADALSRGKMTIRLTEWALNMTIVNLLFLQLGTPVIDLFATSMNKKLPVFCSPWPEETAVSIDALSMKWTNLFAYAFPPPIILNRILQKIQKEDCVILLIAPMWPRQSWYSQLLNLLIDFPIQLPVQQNLLSQNGIFHPNPSVLNLVAWKVSKDLTLQKDFHQKLLQLFPMHENNQHRQFIMQDSSYLTAGVKNGVSIPVRQLCQK